MADGRVRVAAQRIARTRILRACVEIIRGSAHGNACADRGFLGRTLGHGRDSKRIASQVANGIGAKNVGGELLGTRALAETGLARGLALALGGRAALAIGGEKLATEAGAVRLGSGQPWSRWLWARP